jgi:acetolactate synthase-1/2/3 large subunit
VVSLAGDGSYFFSVPSAVHFIAHRYATPFLTVIYNNGGYNATKQNTLRLHPEGVAQQNDTFWVSLGHEPDLAGIAAAAGGSFARTVSDPGALRDTLREALAAVAGGRAAVVDVRLERISQQAD